ncbi:MAG: hypothetical protein ABW023_15515 [Sphingomonas sp.]
MFRRLLALVFLFAPAAAHADWYEVSTGHFVIYSDQKPERLREFATNLERFDKALRLRLNQRDDPVGKANRVTIYVVDDISDVVELAGKRGVAGFYRARAGGSLAIVPKSAGNGAIGSIDAQLILLHEYTHHLMWSFSPNTVYPGWYVEGFAEFFASAIFDKDGSVILGAPPQYRARVVMDGNALPVEKLLVSQPLTLKDDQRAALYGRGWLLLHYLIYGDPARKGQLDAYIDALNKGRSPTEAASVFGDLRKLDAELERYKRGTFPRVRVTAAALPIGDIALRRLTDGEAATMAVRIRSKNGVGGKLAQKVYDDARKAAKDYPGDPGAQLVLAEAAFDARDLPEAEAAADRALAADPKAVDGYVYKALARILAANQARDRSKATWDGIRKIVATGNRLDPEDPEPLLIYYRTFAQNGIPPSASAKLGLAKAFSLAPQDRNLRFRTAVMYLEDGKKAEARALLAPLAYRPHGQALAQRAAQIIATIDAGVVADAIKQADRPVPAGEEADNPNGDQDR